MTKQTEQDIQHLPPDVYRAELEEINERRKAAGLGELPPEALEASGPALEHGLAGLALSGGGIRSSTFSLGVIQSLVRARLFKHFDYVSTVSGGGYTGSMLSSLLGTPQPPTEPFPLQKEPGQAEPPALQHLRNGSNYLSPDGLLDRLRLPLQVLRGLLCNVVLLMPWLVLAACVTGLWYVFEQFLPSSSLPRPFLAVVPLIAMLLLSPIIARWCRGVLGWKARNFLTRTMAALLGLTLLGLVLVPFEEIVRRALHASLSLDRASQLRWVLLEPMGLDMPSRWLPVLKWGSLALVVLVAVTLLGPVPTVRKRLRNLALVAIGLLGPSVLFGSYVLFCLVLPSPFLPKQLGKEFPSTAEQRPAVEVKGKLKDVLHWKVFTLPDTYCISQLPGKDPQWPSWRLAGCKNAQSPGTQSPDTSSNNSYLTSSNNSYLLVWNNVGYELKDENVEHFQDKTLIGSGIVLGVYLVLSGLLLLLTLLFIDVNYTSLHQFYRDRLSRLYLFRVRGREVVSTDNLRLSQLNETGSTAPYHLLNVTLNLQGSTSRTLRGRKSGFFIFSKRYCGGPQTGYCPTPEMEKADPRMSLGTAMAISAAAASPNMGTMELGSLRTLMALLNVRLGYWAPNPEYLSRSRRPLARVLARLRFLLGPGSTFLLRETFGSVNATGSYINVSDGGHLENLGVYELLRRRCKVVVAIDGEADPKMSFGGLHVLMRYAWIDLGIRIELEDLGELGLKNGASSQHYALGTIDYGQEGKGVFIYIKSSVTGDESPVMAHYRAEHPEFPHQSTADQFFDEHQFESYRELGEHIGSQLAEKEEFKALFSAERLPPAAQLDEFARRYSSASRPSALAS